MSETATTMLDQADACHDDDPGRAAALLRGLDLAAVPADRRPGLAFLLNHVLGEKFGAWAEAQTSLARLLDLAGDGAPVALWRQAAAAAPAAADEAGAARLVGGLATASGARAEQARDVVALTVAMYRVPTQPAMAAAEVASTASACFAQPAWHQASPLDAAVAACANNIASDLVERPADDLKAPAVRNALEGMAELAERFWLRAGNWVHHERAAYLRAMVGNAVGEPAQARAHALRALALLDTHDTERAERVDRAFIELERARACRDLARQDEARDALAAAEGLAAAFDGPGLVDWFSGRRAKLGLA